MEVPSRQRPQHWVMGWIGRRKSVRRDGHFELGQRSQRPQGLARVSLKFKSGYSYFHQRGTEQISCSLEQWGWSSPWPPFHQNFHCCDWVRGCT